jgi:hypothetical protein
MTGSRNRDRNAAHRLCLVSLLSFLVQPAKQAFVVDYFLFIGLVWRVNRFVFIPSIPVNHSFWFKKV